MVWNRLLYAIVLFGCGFCSHHLSAQSPWWYDVDEALQSVDDDERRILIVVQFHADFLASPRGSRDLELFERFAIDKRTRQWLDQHALLVAQNVGPSHVLQLQPPGEANEDGQAVNAASSREPDPGQCVTWFCETGGKVLFCLIGYPDAAEFYRRARWSHLAAVRFADQDRPFRSEYHERQFHDKDGLLFFETLEKVRRDDEKTNTPASDLQQAIEALARVRQQRLLERFGESFNKGDAAQLTAFLNQHAAFESELMHVSLSHEPGPQREEMQRIVWQRLCGMRMWSADQQELVAWVEYQTSRRRPLMLRIIDQYTDDDPWPPASPVRLGELLDEFAEREVSLDDVAVIAAHYDFSEIIIPADKRPMFVAATSRGDSWKLHTHRDSLAELTRTLGRINTLQRQRQRQRQRKK